MRSKLHGKQARQEGAIERTEAQLAIHEQQLVNDKDNKVLKKKVSKKYKMVEI